MTESIDRDELLARIRDGERAARDVPAYLQMVCDVGNEDAAVQDEVRRWDRAIHLCLEGLGSLWLAVAAGRFTTGVGAPAGSDLTLRMTADEAARILVGDRDAKASYLAGALTVDGPLPDAVRFQTVVGLVIDALAL